MKNKALIVSIVLTLIGVVSFAQTDKNYLSGIVKVNATYPNNGYIYIYLEGEPRKTELLKGKEVSDYSPVLESIAKLKAEGWEIESNQVADGYLYYFLRKKKN